MAFKMKGNPMKRNFGKHIPKYKTDIPGINNKSEGNTDKPDGRSASSAFQYHDDTKKGTPDWKRSHWPDGKERSAREIFEYDETMEEERRDEERQEPVTKKPEPMTKASATKATTTVTSKQTDAPETKHADGKTYSGTLSSYYKGKGKKLPSVSERAKLYKTATGDKDTYKGTSEQNKKLYNKLTTETTKTVSKSSDIGKGEKGDIKSVEKSGYDAEGAYATKTNVEKGAGIKDPSDIKEEDIKKTKERGRVRARIKARKAIKKAEKESPTKKR